jgi:hypothetical protein
MSSTRNCTSAVQDIVLRAPWRSQPFRRAPKLCLDPGERIHTARASHEPRRRPFSGNATSIPHPLNTAATKFWPAGGRAPGAVQGFDAHIPLAPKMAFCAPPLPCNRPEPGRRSSDGGPQRVWLARGAFVDGPRRFPCYARRASLYRRIYRLAVALCRPARTTGALSSACERSMSVMFGTGGRGLPFPEIPRWRERSLSELSSS